jgi:YD repeat-containing protein
MNVLARWSTGALIFLSAFSSLAAENQAEDGFAERVIRSHATFLNEISDRRRVNSIFPNEQSPLYGVPIRYVNSSRGNLTFVRRDLVSIGHLPVVVARVYDSTLRHGTDFGAGWRLAAEETITRQSDGEIIYVDDSGSKIALVRAGGGYVLRDSTPTDITSIRADGRGVRISLRSGWSKEFSRLRDSFVLTTVRDAHGNALSFIYQGAQLNRIQGQNGRFVQIERNRFGRIARVTDDQGRHVVYGYDGRGRLETVTDFGGNAWRYEYDRAGLLQRIIDPRNAEIMLVAYDSRDRARSVRILGAQYRYGYAGRETAIEDEAKRVTRVAHDRNGIATSIINANGFRSQITLDQLNRVTALFHNGSARATVRYRATGEVESLTRLDGERRIEFAFEHDDVGRVTRVSSASGPDLTLEYNATGDLLKKSEDNETTEYAYNPLGDLTLVKQGDEATVYTHNADGQIETITSSRGTTRLTYFPDGKVKSIQFAEGSVHEYRHNALGFREATHRNDGTRMYYEYDVSGNLVRSDGSSADGRVAGQVLDVDENARVVGIHYANGDDTAITYDEDGNPQTLDDGSGSPFEYIYDGTNRLVAVRQGDRITGSHVYAPTEPDLRLQLDDRTMRVGANALRQSTSIGGVLSLLYARPYGSTAGVVRFDQATRSFDLPTEFGIVLPDAVATNSLVRRKLVDVDDGDVRRRVDFDRPSNVIFVPPEYATINCGIGCTFTGITLRANGSTGPITVFTGTVVSLLASKNSGSGCTRLLCQFSANGVPIPSDGLNSTSTAFSTPGTYIVHAGCECSGCDLFGDDTVTVNVVAAPFCAVPTNFRQTSVQAAGVGIGTHLLWTYAWDSSTGNRNDLGSCLVGEIVDYPGIGPGFFYQSPPFPTNPTNGTRDPTEINVRGSDGGIGDRNMVPGIGNFRTPYSSSSVTAIQNWRYSCPCKNAGAWINLFGPLHINRSVSQNANGSWKYTITKPIGGAASFDPLP